MRSRWPAILHRPRIARCRPSSSGWPVCCPKPYASRSASSISTTSSRTSTRRWPGPARDRRGSRPRNKAGGAAMTPLFDKDRPIKSPALAPAQGAFERAGAAELTIGLVNNMPDSALKATERQFMRLVQAAAGDIRVNFHCFSLPAVARSRQASEHIAHDYADIADLDRLGIDGLIVTGAEPIAPSLPDEPFWGQLTEIIDWAKTNTRSTIWSCLAAHAAVLHLNGVERHRLSAKCSGVFDCTRGRDNWLTRDVPAMLKVSHSRYNELRESELT